MFEKFVRFLLTPLVHDSARGVWTKNGKVVQTDGEFANAQATFFNCLVVFCFIALVAGIFLVAW